LNSCVEIDLTGQVCSDSIGGSIISGVGGQLDFMSASIKTEGGRAIIALPSQTKKGEMKIVPHLKTGAGVVTPRSLVHHVVTEFGSVNLFGKSLIERSKLLISIAHPGDRDYLTNEARSRFGTRI
jgi:4-hydroxybutyrate CoA-transferase